MSETVLLNNETDLNTPGINLFNHWAEVIIHELKIDFQVSILIVDKITSQHLNKTYRDKDYATNVLSFPMNLPEEVEEILIGDLAICAEVVVDEAKLQQKQVEDHWAHLCIHGILHLLGYDHELNADAEVMESLEIKILNNLNISNPYD